MPLSENEKRDAIKLIEQGKPLPDAYRFKLFEDKREVELVWNGKTSEVTNVVLPFQVIEQVDEPRDEKVSKETEQLSFQHPDFDPRGRQIGGWTNKLIWGDNKLILSSLKNGPLREAIEKQGGIKLIYIDPPFDVGADFSMDIEIGGETLTKKPSVIEELAYRDTWGKGADSFIAMIYERLSLMRDLLAADGSIYVHCDYRVSAHLRFVLEELFGAENFVNEIIWKRRSGILAQSKQLGNATDTILFFSKTDNFQFKPPKIKEGAEDYIEERFKYEDENGRKYRLSPLVSPSYSPNLVYEYKGYAPPKNGWSCSLETMQRFDQEGKLVFPKDQNGRIQRKQFLDEWEGRPVQSLWSDIPPINPQALERLDYPTQKPEKLLERILEISSSGGDVIADLFCGSGTTLAVAEKLGRKWIGSDLGKFSIHTTRKRMIGVQRELKAKGINYRAFEILNLGKYQREHFVGVNPELADEQKQAQLAAKEADYVQLITQAYRAEAIDGFRTFNAKRAGRMVVVGPINVPVSRLLIDEVVKEAQETNVTKVDVIAFDFEMDLTPRAQDEAKKLGIDLALKYIPPDVFDKRAIDKNQVKFFDVGYIEVRPNIKGRTVAIELTDFSVFYNQNESMDEERLLKPGSSKVVIRDGQVMKLSKDKDGVVAAPEILTKHWTDWIDYWSVDFNYASKKEMIRRPKQQAVIEQQLDGSADPIQKSMDYEEVWTGSYIFENEWQDFRTKKKRDLQLTTVAHEYAAKGRYQIAIKVVDIFGNDTMKVIEVNI